MRQTVGNTDRVLRGVLAIGAVVASGVVGFSSGWGIVLLAVAAIMFVTGASGYCPAYSLIGISTCGKDECAADDGRARHLHRRAA
ncbi:MAG: DUF2892 domain-containing protein [Actinomycetota bacterium]|nr:DUF2892 domain-containing protein [Actinomycetota bacterium]